MILFLDDWRKYPYAIPHESTNNQSAIRFAWLLKQMGIKNYFFHLALHDRDLAHVNPYDPDLDHRTKAKIIAECDVNPWYFFREVAMLNVGGKYNHIRFNRGLISVYWCFFNNMDYMLIMIRQTGKSLSANFLHLYLLYLKYFNAKTFLYTKDVKRRKTNIKDLKMLRDIMPPWLIPSTKKDADNLEYLTCSARENILLTDVGQANTVRAGNVARGEQIFFGHSDEGAHTVNSQISLPVLLTATTAGREVAKEQNVPYGNLFTTTPGYLDTPHGAYFFKQYQSGAVWVEDFYDMNNRQELELFIRKNTRAGEYFTVGEFNHRQLGFTDQWLYERIRVTKGTKEEILQNYFNMWTAGNNQSPIAEKYRKIITENRKDPEYIEKFDEGYMIRWYKPKEVIHEYLKEHHVVMGNDTSNAIGSDGNALVLVDIESLETIGAANIYETNNQTYAFWIADLLIKYPNITYIPEMRSSAYVIIDVIIVALLTADIDPFKRIFNMIVNDRDSHASEYKEISTPLSRRSKVVYEKYKKYFGYATSGGGTTSRDTLMKNVLLHACKSIPRYIKDKPLIAEITSLIVKHNRIDHPTGCHDDLVIAWLLAIYLIRFGKNLEYYGIPTNRCLAYVVEEGGDFTEEDKDKIDKITQLREEITRYKELAVKTKSRIESMKILRYIRHKVAQLNTLGDVSTNLDTIIKEIDFNKKQSRFMNKNK